MDLTVDQIALHELGHILAAGPAALMVEELGHYPAKSYPRVRVHSMASSKGGQVGCGILKDDGEPEHPNGDDRLRALTALGPTVVNKNASTLLQKYQRTGDAEPMNTLITSAHLSDVDLQEAANWTALEPRKDHLQLRVIMATAKLYNELGSGGRKALTATLLEMTSQRETMAYLTEWVPEAAARWALDEARREME